MQFGLKHDRSYTITKQVTIVFMFCWIVVITACSSGGDQSIPNSASLAQLPPTNSVSIPGNFQDYTISRHSTNTVVTESANGGQLTLALDVDWLNFYDLRVNLRILKKVNKIAPDELNRMIGLYLVYFEQVPDSERLEPLLDKLANGASVSQISADLYVAATAETIRTGYSRDMTSSIFISKIFKSLFGDSLSTFDPNSQFSYQIQRLATGKISRSTFVYEVLDGGLIQSTSLDLKALSLLKKKIEIGYEFAVKLGISGMNAEHSNLISEGLVKGVTIDSRVDQIAVCKTSLNAGPPSNEVAFCLSPVLGTISSHRLATLQNSFVGYWFFGCNANGQSMIMHFDVINKLRPNDVSGVLISKTKLRQYASPDCSGEYTEILKSDVSQQQRLAFFSWDVNSYGKYTIRAGTENKDINGGGALIINTPLGAPMTIVGTTWKEIREVPTFQFPDAILRPIADAGLAQSTVVGQQVQFDAEGSYSTQAFPLSYSWRLVSKPNQSGLELLENDKAKITLFPDKIGVYELELLVTNKGVSSLPTRTKLIVEENVSAERSVVIQVTGTSPQWGQESEPGWLFNTPVKDAQGFAMYDIEIGRNSSGLPAFVKLYKADNNHPSYGKMAAYMQSKLLLSVSIESENNSSKVLNALKLAIDRIYTIENPTRTVITYAGHGGPNVFFENALTMQEGQQFISHVRAAKPSSTLILDFSTNCNVGFFDFVKYFYSNADYLVASEFLVGGFQPGEINHWLRNRHASNFHRFFEYSKSTRAALESIAVARRNVWLNSEVSIVERDWQTSVAIYDLSKFRPLMQELVHDKTFKPLSILPIHQNDLGTYALSSKSVNLQNSFLQFRLIYESNRDMVPWTINKNGFSIFDLNDFDAFLAKAVF